MASPVRALTPTMARARYLTRDVADVANPPDPPDPPDLRRLPVTRAECQSGPRPCPHTACRYHLASDLVGKAKRLVARTLPTDMSCALDLADRGVLSHQDIGAVLGVTKQRVEQIERRALAKLGAGDSGELLAELHREGEP